MTSSLGVLAVGAVKAGVLLGAAGLVEGALRRQSARVRAGVWSLALAGSLAVPLAAPLVPPLEALDRARRRAGCRRPVRLVVSPRVAIPATSGLLRPVVVLPPGSARWPADRRAAVLLHEVTHIVRFDWPVRLIARLARSIHWFNPIAWWAVRRLDLAQELACDEHVLALGARPSSYACHLLGIARAAVLLPVSEQHGLAMARRSDLEERIMNILRHPTERRPRPALVIGAGLLAVALVPALAAVQPLVNPPEPSAAELPPLAEVQLQIEEQIRHHLEKTEEIHLEMAPLHDHLEAIHRELEPLQRDMERVHTDMEPVHREVERLHESMEPIRREMEEVHREMGSVHERMGRLEGELRRALRDHVATVLRDSLAPVVAADAPFDETAARLVGAADTIRIDDGRVHLSIDEDDTRSIVGDLLAPRRTGDRPAFDAAVARAAAALSRLELAAD